MNTETNQTTSSSSTAGAVKKHWSRAFIYLLLYLALAGIWSYCCASCIRTSGDKPGIGTGSGGGGGRGASDSGSGSGAGPSGSGSGKLAQAPAQPAAGSGNKTGEAGSSGTANTITPSGVPGNVSNTAASDSSVLQQVESIAYHQPAPEVKSGGAGNVAGRKGFYGLETGNSIRSIFIVDTSGSMGAMSSELPGKSRVEVLKMELEKSIFNPKRPNIGGFIIFAFNSQSRRFPEKTLCRYRDTKAMQEARQFINVLHAGGGTMMIQAWEKALDTAKKENIDTIYFMTDGQPGDNFSDQWLLAQLSKYRFKKLKIHCVSVGMDQQFMKKISDHTHGTYIYIP